MQVCSVKPVWYTFGYFSGNAMPKCQGRGLLNTQYSGALRDALALRSFLLPKILDELRGRCMPMYAVVEAFQTSWDLFDLILVSMPAALKIFVPYTSQMYIMNTRTHILDCNLPVWNPDFSSRSNQVPLCGPRSEAKRAEVLRWSVSAAYIISRSQHKTHQGALWLGTNSKH